MGRERVLSREFLEDNLHFVNSRCSKIYLLPEGLLRSIAMGFGHAENGPQTPKWAAGLRGLCTWGVGVVENCT